MFAAAVSAQTIVVTGSREPMAIDRLAADIVVIDAEQIRNSSADSLGDLLRREAGLQLSRSGGPGHASGLFMRGANTTQLVVLVDGVRIGSATLGQPSLDGLALQNIDHIEVLRGPGSSLYGADAIGGVVQVFTRRGEPGWRFNAGAAVGGYGSSQASAGIDGASGAWDAAASLSHEKSAGVSTLRPSDEFGNYNPDRDGYRLDSAQAQIGFRPAPGQRIGLTLLRSRLNDQYDASEYPPPTYAQDNTPDFRDKLKTEVGALDWRGTLSPGLTGSARVSRSVDDLNSGGNIIDTYRTTRDRVGAQLAWAAGVVGQLVAALEHGSEKAATTTYVSDVQRHDNAAVLALTGEAAPGSWQADLRRDDDSEFGGVTTWRLGGGYLLVPGLKLRALVGTTYRAPSFNDLYYPGYGVPTLQPERGRSAEIGLVWRREGGEAAATVYRNRVRDLINYEGDRSFCPADPAYDFGCARNVGRAKLDGGTLSGRRQVGPVTLGATLDFTDAKDATTGARLNRRAAHQASISADWNGGDWNLGTRVLQLGARPDAGVVLASETTIDFIGSWRFAKGWTLQAKLLNASNRDIEPARDYQGLGRQAWLGLRYEGGP